MAPISPGKMSGPPRRMKKPTASTKAHRFEGFAKRVTKIKIDPVHTVQQTRVSEIQNDLTTSYFRSGLDEWAELNLSINFTRFLNKAQPLSESLPQLLHHADALFSLLHSHIEKEDVISLEPLLSLVAHLAHDLGSSFEKYFASTVNLVAKVSASVEEPAAVEQCFTCLAWMFKYLSRLLVQDLRPLLEIMVPYFSSKKDYVRRFSAESLAFLLRKAAIMYPKKSAPLKNALTYLLSQLDKRAGVELDVFTVALMTLFFEATMGVDAQLHSCAADFFACLFEIVETSSLDSQHALTVLDGTIIALVHQTDAAGFKPLLQLITAMSEQSNVHGKIYSQMRLGLLFDVVVTRKGSRISDWKDTIQSLLSHLNSSAGYNIDNQNLHSKCLAVVAAILQYCPMNQLFPFVNRLSDDVISFTSPKQYFAFCEMVAKLGSQRFQDLLLPSLQQYIISNWTDNEDGLCYHLRRLEEGSSITPRVAQTGYMACPKDWEQYITKELSSTTSANGFMERYARYFRLHEAIHFPKQTTVRQTLKSHLGLSIKTVLHQQDIKFDMQSRLTLGWAFKFYISLFEASETTDTGLAAPILSCRPEYYQLEPFLQSCLDIVDNADYRAISNVNIDVVSAALCNNMLSSSKPLRESSLRLLRSLGKLYQNEWLREASSLMLEILTITYSPANIRQIAMLIRRLPKIQEASLSASNLHKLLPLFALGMLRHYHDHTRKELGIALGHMSNSGNAEDIILDVAVQWLQKPGALDVPETSRPEPEKSSKLSPFECSNYKLVQSFSDSILNNPADAAALLQEDFEMAHSLWPAINPIESRVLALQVFLEVPEIAERRSRALSPVFLSVRESSINHHIPRSDESASSHTVSPELNDHPWSLHERKLFLELVGKFINPRVLYRSRELYDHLLELLANGNSEIRRLALVALLNWKDKSLLQYQDVLLRVAEEKNATSELALLLASDEDTASIKQYDRDSVLPILLRLIFGQLVGRSGTHGSQEAKRKSILRLLFRMQEREVNIFLSIALGRLEDISFSNQPGLNHSIIKHELLPQDQQYGFLRMMITIQETLQIDYAPYGKRVMDAIVYCTARSWHQSHNLKSDDMDSSAASALTKNIRRTGIQCLTAIFEYCTDIEWDKYLPTIFREVITPRVPNLAIEFAQGVSSILKMLSTWCKSNVLVHFFKFDDNLTQKLWKILSVPSARDEVKIYVLETILSPLLELASDKNIEQNSAIQIIQSDVDFILNSLESLLQVQPSKSLLLAVTKTIQPLAPYAISSTAANNVLNLLVALLCEPNQRIPPHVKGQLLSATESLLHAAAEKVSLDTEQRLFSVVSGLYNYFKDQPNRATLSKLLSTLSHDKPHLQQAVQICNDLNATSMRHLDEIDYEKQLSAYNTINTLLVTQDSMQQWVPILNNLLYFARTADDFAITSNAVSCLKRFIAEACDSQSSEADGLTRTLLLPAFQKAVKEDSEIVRADFVNMYGLVIKHLRNAPELEDMKVLLVGDDEEASFFTNILHIQQHRRLRAVRRLLMEVERGAITPSNIADYFLPLLEKFIDDEGDDENAQGMKGQSILATSTLLQWVNWKSFRTTFRRYRTDLDAAARPEKDAIKLMNYAAEALTMAVSHQTVPDSDNGILPFLSTTLPAKETISTELKTHFIPKLSNFIHHRDEAEISLRIPAAKVAVKLIKLLSADEVPLLVSPIILDISQILRSRTQESRDIARNTLAEIVLLLGPSSVQFVVKQMRTSLLRGYQLHVLSYTLHTILLQSSESRVSGDLDYCLEDLISVIMDDIFGAVGQEKENQDYISSMREVKSSKSQDSMELLARCTSVKYLRKLVQPFYPLLAGSLSIRQVRHIDELFRRIGVGISHNTAASNRDLLVFAYELIQEFYRQKAGKADRAMTNDEKNRQRFLVQLKSANATSTSSASSLQYKVARFALDIVRSTMTKHAYLLTAENVHGFLPIIGDAIVEAQEDVRLSAMRLLSTIIRLPLPELDQNASLYVMEAVKIVKGSISTSEEAPQAALKLVATILRERKSVEVRDSDVAYLLHRTMPDIEEPDKQGVIFNFIKSVMARQYQVPEVYELMDKVAVMMVTNQSRSGRDAARGVFVHFLLQYPQSQSRWAKQLKFMVKNLDYEHREGRQSVMEAVHFLLQKLGTDEEKDIVSTFFIPIILRMSNDDDSACREMAGALLAQIFRVTTPTQLTSLLEPLRGWLEQTDNSALVKISMQAWTTYFDTVENKAEIEILSILRAINRVLQMDSDTTDDDWQLQYQALELFSKIVLTYPSSSMTANQSNIWSSIRQFLTSQHMWLQIAATGLVNMYFQGCMIDGRMEKLPLLNKQGLRWDAKVVRSVLHDTVRVLKRNEENPDLAQKTMQNILFLSKVAESANLTCEVKAITANGGEKSGVDQGIDAGDDSTESESEASETRSIPAIQYLLDQLIYIIRREPKKLTTAAFTPKISALSLLETLISQLSLGSLPESRLISVLVPLTHITNPSVQPPRSIDATFSDTYQAYIESAQTLQDAIQRKIGDKMYINLMTAASKIVRERRGERRMKRAIDRVAEPERAEKEKQRKKDIKARRKKSIVDIHRKKRRSDLGF